MLIGVFFTLVITLVIAGSSSLILPSPVQAAVSESPALVVVAGKIKIKPGHKEEFTKLAEKCLTLSRQEPGSISYSFYEDQTAPNTFLYFEEWRDQASLDYHFSTPYFKALIDQAGPLFAEAPEIKVYKIDSYKTL